MSEAMELIQRAKIIRDRLRSPPNAIKDRGIDLKGHRIPLSSKSVLVPKLTCRVSIRTVRLASVLHTGNMRFLAITRAVCHRLKISPEQLRGDSRRAPHVFARHIIFYIARTRTGLSMPQIGKFMGGKDHTTVLHGARKIAELILVDDALAEMIRLIEHAVFAGYYDSDYDIGRPPLASLAELDLAQGPESHLPQSQICELDHGSGLDRQGSQAQAYPWDLRVARHADTT